MTDKLKIRPFDRSIDFGNATQVRCSASITENGLALRLGESPFDLAGEPGDDDRGPYVLIEPVQREVLGFQFTVEKSFEEDEEPGVHISLRELDPVVSELQRQNPNAHLIYPSKSAVMSLYFTSDGTMDGSSGRGSPDSSKRSGTH